MDTFSLMASAVPPTQSCYHFQVPLWIRPCAPAVTCHTPVMQGSGTQPRTQRLKKGQVTYSRTRTPPGTGSMTSVPAVPFWAHCCTGKNRSDFRWVQPKPCPVSLSQAALKSRKPSVCLASAVLGAFLDTLSISPHYTHFTEQQTEAQRVAVSCPSLSVMTQTGAGLCVGSSPLTR